MNKSRNVQPVRRRFALQLLNALQNNKQLQCGFVDEIYMSLRMNRDASANVGNHMAQKKMPNKRELTLGLPRGGWLPPTPFVFLHHPIDSYRI